MPVLPGRRNVAEMSRRVQVLFRVNAFPARRVRRLATGPAIIAAVLGVAACSSHKAPAVTLGSLSSLPASAPARPPAGPTLTGTQLGSALAPPSSFPGFAEDTQDTYRGGTGTVVLQSQYKLATMSCTSFSKHMLFATWFGQTAIAWAHFNHVTADQWTQTYDEFIYQFADASAAGSFLQALRSAFVRCQSYSDVESGVTVRTTYAVADLAPVDGGQAMQVTGTAATATAGTAAGSLLYVLRGNKVYGVVRAGESPAVPASPPAATVIQGMMAQVQAMGG